MKSKIETLSEKRKRDPFLILLKLGTLVMLLLMIFLMSIMVYKGMTEFIFTGHELVCEDK